MSAALKIESPRSPMLLPLAPQDEPLSSSCRQCSPPSRKVAVSSTGKINFKQSVMLRKRKRQDGQVPPNALALFPIDRSEIDTFFDECAKEREAETKRLCQKYNFDFESESVTDESASARFEWSTSSR
eukprot:GILJ01011843.1.p2 GENE.GILJ01011843.1~~GILJ01011843.1.p2  ORF type:complete len:128 (+),score=18.03 GILJ01011843.1:262-645(+)